MSKRQLAAMTRKAKAEYGERSLGAASSVGSEDRRISTGSLDLDIGLGGGIRVGGIASFFGDQGGGKTTSALRTVGIAQNLCRNCYRPAKNVVAVEPSAEELAEDPGARWSAKGECDCFATRVWVPREPTAKELSEQLSEEAGEKVAIKANSKAYSEALEQWKADLSENSYEEVVVCYADFENKLDLVWAETLGVDTRRMLLLRASTAEWGIDVLSAFVETTELDFLVIDSLAHLTPAKELTESMEKWQQGLQARLVNKGIRKLVSGSVNVNTAEAVVTQIWINQTREKIGVLFGDPTTKPGGKGQSFAICQEVKFMKAKQETAGDQWGSNKNDTFNIAIKETIKYKITKQQTAATMSWTGSYVQALRGTDAYPAGAILEDEYIHKLTIKYLAEKVGKVGQKVGDREFSSAKAVLVAIREDEEFCEEVKLALKKFLAQYVPT